MVDDTEARVHPGDEADILRAAVAVANVPTLLMVLVQLTGELHWLDAPYLPSRTKGMGDNDTGELPVAVQDEIRSACLDAIVEWRAGRPVAIPAPSEHLMLRMLSTAMGETIPAEYGPMIQAELRAASSQDEAVHSIAPPPGFRVVIIGAGAAGLCAAVRLGEAGIPYLIVERNDSVGGTWFENRYPGAGVDTPNHLYSFTFAKYDWSRYFVGQPEIVSYLEQIATDFDVRSRIRFSTEVTAANYDEHAQHWAVQVRNADGALETLVANVVISAVGIFNPPKYPDIDGLDTFSGPVVHTARWQPGLDLAGKRVGIVGNGASAMQLGPAIAGDVASLTIFQRSPHWIAPFELFKTSVPDPVRFLLREVPLYQAWYRLRLGWVWNDKTYPSLQKDPTWEHPERSLNAINEGYRRVFTRYLEGELGDRQDLVDAVLPSYPPFGKRMLLDNGWYRMLTRDNVALVSDSIAEVRGDRIVASAGDEFEVDVIVLATGFDVIHFLSSYEVNGRSGQSLQDVWGDNAKAYLGMTVPEVPNFICLYGPNTQPGHGGSILCVTEWQVHYILDLFEQMFSRGLGSFECRSDVHRTFNERVDEMHERMVWTHPGMQTYYRNSQGRVVANTPYRNVDVWAMTRHADLDDYLTEPAHDREGSMHPDELSGRR